MTYSPKLKGFLNKLADLNFFIFTGKPYLYNVSSGFRCFSKEAIKKILPHLKENGYGIELETLKVAKQYSLRIGEIPVSFDYSVGKKANLWKLFKGYLDFDIECLKQIWKSLSLRAKNSKAIK